MKRLLPLIILLALATPAAAETSANEPLTARVRNNGF